MLWAAAVSFLLLKYEIMVHQGSINSGVEDSEISTHAAAMELAPSKKPTISLEDAFEPVAEDSPVESEIIPQEEQAALVRIRVLMTSPEPILTASGESLELEAGDVHFVDQDSADWLIESGVAEAAAL